MDWIGVAAITALLAYIAHNLGLADKVYAVCGDIVKCPMCFAFWCTLFVLVVIGCKFLAAIALSLIFAYLTNWFALLWDRLNLLYERLWKRTTNKRNR